MPKETFVAVIHREKDSYVAYCPEIGTVARGTTIESALEQLELFTDERLQIYKKPDHGKPIMTSFTINVARGRRETAALSDLDGQLGTTPDEADQLLEMSAEAHSKTTPEPTEPSVDAVAETEVQPANEVTTGDVGVPEQPSKKVEAIETEESDSPTVLATQPDVEIESTAATEAVDDTEDASHEQSVPETEDTELTESDREDDQEREEAAADLVEENNAPELPEVMREITEVEPPAIDLSAETEDAAAEVAEILEPEAVVNGDVERESESDAELVTASEVEPESGPENILTSQQETESEEAAKTDSESSSTTQGDAKDQPSHSSQKEKKEESQMSLF